MSLQERLLAKIEKRDGGYTSPCWFWTGAMFQNGYAAIKAGRRAARAHRVSYETFIGPIPDDLTIDHLCRNKSCVNPDHLEPVTNKENFLRAVFPKTHGFNKREKTHCPKGHAYDTQNTHITPQGWRKCKICQRQKSNEWHAKNREYNRDWQRRNRGAAA